MLLVLFISISTVFAHSEYLPALLKLNSKSNTQKHKFVNNENQFFRNIRNITNGGTNAESYWSFDGKKFSFQSIRLPLARTHQCDQIYSMNADGTNVQLVGTGTGRDTCSYYFPDGINILFSMTTNQAQCPPEPDQNAGYLWPIYHDMDIFIRNTQNSQMGLLFNSSAYDAESTISPDGKSVIFTTARDGDLELYTMNLDGSNLRRMTYTPGYDGGAYFSFNNKMFCWRANRPQASQLLEYFSLLNYGIVSPVLMQIMVQDVALQTPPVQLTNNQGTNFAPFFLPDDSGVIFSSNLHDPQGGDFQLYTVGLAGGPPVRITTQGSFNSFPMFSPDGTKIAWCSSRNAKQYGDIDVFVADWIGPGSKLF